MGARPLSRKREEVHTLPARRKCPPTPPQPRKEDHSPAPPVPLQKRACTAFTHSRHTSRQGGGLQAGGSTKEGKRSQECGKAGGSGFGLLVRGHDFRSLLVLPLHLHADVLGGVVTVHLHQLDDCRWCTWYHTRAKQQRETGKHVEKRGRRRASSNTNKRDQ